MEVFECIKTRRAVRKFEKKEVTWEEISMILDAGRLAPSSGNLQNWKFIVALDEGKKKSVAEACVNQDWIASAPVIIVVVGEHEKGKRFYGKRGAELYTSQNCAAAAQNMLLEAHNLGLGSCWVGGFNEDQIRRIFGMPEEVTPYVVIPIGYAEEEAEEPAKFPIENVTYFNGWRGKIRDVPAYFYYYSANIQKGLKKGKALAEKHGETLAEKGKELIENIKKKFKKT